MYEALTNAAEVVAGVLGIAVTVVAIIVELAATRYNHRITTMFVREPLNLVLVFFVATTIVALWAPSVPEDSTAHLIAMSMVSISLVLLLPYFAFVVLFISPLSIIRRIQRTAIRCIEKSRQRFSPADRETVIKSIDALQDVARVAADRGDRDIAMECVRVLGDMMIAYQSLRDDLPLEWFQIDATIAGDVDFISLETSAVKEIEDEKLWLELKILRQYQAIVMLPTPGMLEVANLIGIHTRKVMTALGPHQDAVLDLCIRCFNSFLRSSIAVREQKTTYYLFDQYRLLGVHLLQVGNYVYAKQVAQYLAVYGEMAYLAGRPFLLELAADDLALLIEFAATSAPETVDDMLKCLLELDQEIRNERHELSLLGVRRAQIKLATFFLDAGDERRARLIARDLKDESRERLDRLRSQLETNDQERYWEFNDRGSVNFSYLAPERRPYLERLYSWL